MVAKTNKKTKAPRYKNNERTNASSIKAALNNDVDNLTTKVRNYRKTNKNIAESDLVKRVISLIRKR